MEKSGKGRDIFNLIGVIIIIFWISMIGLMIKKTSFNDTSEYESQTDKIAIIKETEREWKDIYLRGKKVGYSVSLIQPLEKGYYIQEGICRSVHFFVFSCKPVRCYFA